MEQVLDSGLILPGASPLERRYLEGVRRELRKIGLSLMAGFSNAAELHILDHITGKNAYTSPAPLYLALATVAVGESDTSASITEPTYTGYARKQVPAADWIAASAGETHNNTQEQFANCTSGSNVIISWGLSPVSSTGGAGDIIMFGTVPSTTISTTQTPPTIAASALSLTLD